MRAFEFAISDENIISSFLKEAKNIAKNEGL